MKKILLSLVGFGAVVGAGILGFAYWPTSTRDIVAMPDLNDAQTIERGRYVATASDCVACHTTKDSKPFVGGVPFHTPIGTVFSTNITPDPKTGIGEYTLADFDRAVRHGIRKDGVSVFPAMPYPSYAYLTDQDVADMYAYFMKGVEPVEHANLDNDIPFPLSMRFPLAIWRKAFGADPDAVVFDTKRYPNEEIARGAYLVQGPGHCGACHTPRTATMAEKGLDEKSPDYLAGGQVIDGWFAINLRGNNAEGLGRWSKEDIVETLSGSRNAHFGVVGAPMNEVVTHSMQKMTPSDLQAIASYLKTLPASAGEKATYAEKQETVFDKSGRGAEIYMDSCNACHLSNGRGSINAVPALAGNPTVLAPHAVSTIRVVLDGAVLTSTDRRPADLGMPGFAWRYSDQEVAELVTFLRSTWGNGASAVTSEQVKTVRAALAKEKQSKAPAKH
ncbi:cytochrome c [Agrobacterium tumefaciens]|uniref:cytochrome c n=1 Tax=Agrobacterium tumefaciens TaxID=358 RepID=UPI0021CE913E|nr:cytochrome c [Agrobacterium tumefaciens]UXS05458.1 c-type cytochrome [Agrobacterium tumefaciens]